MSQMNTNITNDIDDFVLEEMYCRGLNQYGQFNKKRKYILK